MVAQGRVHCTVAAHALVESGRCQRQETALAAARHAQVLAVPVGVLLKVVDCTHATHDDALVITLVTVVHAKFPIAVESAISQVVIDALRHGHVDAVDADFECDETL